MCVLRLLSEEKGCWVWGLILDSREPRLGEIYPEVEEWGKQDGSEIYMNAHAPVFWRLCQHVGWEMSRREVQHGAMAVNTQSPDAENKNCIKVKAWQFTTSPGGRHPITNTHRQQQECAAEQVSDMPSASVLRGRMWPDQSVPKYGGLREGWSVGILSPLIWNLSLLLITVPVRWMTCPYTNHTKNANQMQNPGP